MRKYENYDLQLSRVSLLLPNRPTLYLSRLDSVVHGRPIMTSCLAQESGSNGSNEDTFPFFLPPASPLRPSHGPIDHRSVPLQIITIRNPVHSKSAHLRENYVFLTQVVRGELVQFRGMPDQIRNIGILRFSPFPWNRISTSTISIFHEGREASKYSVFLMFLVSVPLASLLLLAFRCLRFRAAQASDAL